MSTIVTKAIGILLSAFIFIIILLSVPFFGGAKGTVYLGIGLLWVILTVLFEFSFGWGTADARHRPGTDELPPRLLLLDEPSLGPAPILVKQIFSIIKEINRQGTSILLVEQNAHKALSVASMGYVLENGRISTTGSSAELKSNKKVQEAYLGGATLKKAGRSSST